MTDRALMAAFSRVKGDLESVLEASRKKEKEKAEALRRETFEKKRGAAPAVEKPREPAKPKVDYTGSVERAPKRVLPKKADTSFGAKLLEEAAAKGASFRSSGKESAESKPRDDKSEKRGAAPREAASSDQRRTGRRQPAENAGRTDAKSRREQSSRQKRPAEKMREAFNSAEKLKPRDESGRRTKLSFIETRNPIPPFDVMPGLPVSERKDELVDAIMSHQVVIVCGETGSGKTTQLPKIALMAGRGRTGMIAHTQPRRIAATSIAKRIAEEMNTELGEVVGYKIRFTDQSSPGASIKLMTDGILLAETQADPKLRRYDTIIIDEAHERSLNIDFLMGYLKKLLESRPDLKVIITSATIDAEKFSRHFMLHGRAAPIFNISGRTYPVEIRWRPIEENDEGDDKTFVEAVDEAIDELFREGPGDALVFLPGEREIRECQEYLSGRRPNVDVLPLFARLTQAEQDRVFSPGKRRRIVLSTNVAETSVTVPGIRYVVDSGLARVKRYSYRSKVEQLLIEPVSRAAANQRSGRCGRVSDGVCIRLYDELDWDRRSEFTDPEIMRANLAGVILKAKSLKLGDIRSFPFVDAPPPKAIADGYHILEELGAVTSEGAITDVGRELSRMPVDPRVGRMLLEGAKRGALSELLVIASGLSVQDPRERPIDEQEAAAQAHSIFKDEKSDFLSYLKLWDWYMKARAAKESNRKFDALVKKQYVSPKRMREWIDVEGQLREITSQLGWRLSEAKATYEEIHKSLLTGLLGNIGSRVPEADYKTPPYVGARGIKFWIWPGSGRAKKSGRWIVSSQLVETSRLYARTVADVDPKWIEEAAGGLVSKSWSDPHWEKARGEVVALEKGTLYGLTLYFGRKVSFASKDPKLAREIFIREALVAGELDGIGSFFAHNQRLVKEVAELEHKTRRLDVLVDDELIVKFYDAHLPEDVCTKAALAAWIKSAPKEDVKKLFLVKEELMRREASGITNRYFPKEVEMAGVMMKASYHFEPGSPRDGVTLEVPLYALNQVDPVKAEWLVPGMVKEKTQALLKSLPQKIRRHCVPLADYAAGFFARVGDGEAQSEPFLEKLSEDIKENLKTACQPSDFKLEQLAPHLVMNFKVVDEDGRMLGMSRSLAELRAEFGVQAQTSFKEMAEDSIEVMAGETEGITGWTFGELPELMEIKRGSETLFGHPALVDCGDSCTIEVFDDPDDAAQAHAAGLRRLFKIALKEQVKQIDRSVRELGRIQMQGAMIPGCAASMESMSDFSDDLVDCALNATALAEPWPSSAESFSERLKDTKGRLILVAGEIVRLVSSAVQEGATITLKLKKLPREALIQKDVVESLEGLFPKRFLIRIPFEQLQHYPRYMKAVQYRIDRYMDDPMRDRSRTEELAALREPYLRMLRSRKGRRDKRLEDFRWLLEELRVSLFAQQLRTPMPVSVKRLQRVWQSIENL